MMNLSYWENKSWLSQIDFTIVGSGIVGLTCALQLRQKYPKAKILILEKGILPQGASTKNAGFACFGSLSEIIDDLNNHTEQEVVALVQKRMSGLALLRKTLGDKTIDYQQNGGFELFLDTDEALYDHCLKHMNNVNELLYPVFGDRVFKSSPNVFNFKSIRPNYIFNPYEGQIDTGKLMQALLKRAAENNVQILNNTSVSGFTENNSSVTLNTNNFELSTRYLFIATNGFSKRLQITAVKPARAQVLITKPIKNLNIKGTFHLDKGYYYFRNIDERILLGGGRHLDFKTEETDALGETQIIQNKLEELLKTVILPQRKFEIDQRWSGIMGVGEQKSPILKSLGKRIFCGVRLGGMGVAIGAHIGRDLANYMHKD